MTVGNTYVVTGANRGIGLEFCKQILESSPDAVVLAAARNISKCEQLETLKGASSGRLHILQLDTSDVESAKAAAAQAETLLPGGLDYLICNAGVAGNEAPPSEESGAMVCDVFKVNVFGVLDVIQAFLPLLKKGTKKTVLNLSSLAGSIANQQAMGFTDVPYGKTLMGYKMSKVALNMMTLNLAAELKPQGFTLVAMHPGLVFTDMGNSVTHLLGGMAGLTPQESVTAMLKTLAGLGPDRCGGFLNYDGTDLPW